jgi:hypothetical protein
MKGLFFKERFILRCEEFSMKDGVEPKMEFYPLSKARSLLNSCEALFILKASSPGVFLTTLIWGDFDKLFPC